MKIEKKKMDQNLSHWLFIDCVNCEMERYSEADFGRNSLTKPTETFKKQNKATKDKGFTHRVCLSCSYKVVIAEIPTLPL